MRLAIDIGNTNITLGVFDNNQIVKTYRLKSDINVSQNLYESELKSISENFNIDSCAIVSVVNELTGVLKSACDIVFKVDTFVFSSKNSGLKINLKEPEKIGADRLVNAYYAIKNCSLPAVIADIGTAITIDIVSKDKEFLGGIIMPGLNLQFNALYNYTSKLPLVKIQDSKNVIGDNTENAMLSGVIRGTACAVEGLIHQCRTELKESATLLATGGQCSVITKYMTEKFDYINPELTLMGLNYAYLDLQSLRKN